MNDYHSGKLIQGDATEKMKELPEESIDLVVTSPPYDNLRDYADGIAWNENVWHSIIDELYRVTKTGGVVVWVVGDATINGSETGTSFKQALYFKKCGFNLHDTMIFEKNSMSMPDTVRYYQKFEYMFVFSKRKPKTFNPLKDRKNKAERWSKKFHTYKKNGKKKERKRTLEKDEYGMRFNIWKYNTGYGFTSDGSIDHPAMFPEKLVEDHILSWSNKGDMVLDPMCGSGTTLMVAHKLSRKWIGIDINPEYIEMAKKRINKNCSRKLFEFESEPSQNIEKATSEDE